MIRLFHLLKERVVEKVALSVKEKVFPVMRKEERLVEKITPVNKDIAGESKVTSEVPVVEVEKMVSSVNEKVASVPYDGEKAAETIAPAVRKETVTEKINRKKGWFSHQRGKCCWERGPLFEGKRGKYCSSIERRRISP